MIVILLRICLDDSSGISDDFETESDGEDMSIDDGMDINDQPYSCSCRRYTLSKKGST